MARAKPVVIPEGYQVTRDGRVISFKRPTPVELQQYPNGSGNGMGYPSVYLVDERGKRKHYAVYRLVAAVYLPPRPSPAHYICHIDGNAQNSHADNLRWDTASSNNYDAWRHRRERQNLALSLDQEVPF